METYRLKNIAILILLLLNGFLLILLGYQTFQSRQSVTDAAGQLAGLYAARDLTLRDSVDLSQSPLNPLSLNRHREADQRIASYLLDGDAFAASQGGGIISYATEYGSIQFRSGGSFDGGNLSRPVDDPAGFARDFCEEFGYRDMSVSVQDGATLITAVQWTEEVPIVGCELRLEFEGNLLTSVTGAHVGWEDAVSERENQLNCVTALVRFLDYRELSSTVCSAVTDLSCVYALEGGFSLRLAPMWRVQTDTYTYFVNCASGEVTRR